MKTSEFYNNKIVLITGGSMGIGKELAHRVLQYGGTVIITGRNQKRLIAVQNEYQEYGKKLMTHTGDVSNYEDNCSLISKIILQFGKLDVLINNAGMSKDFGELEKVNDSVIDELIDTNLKGSIFLSKLAIPELKKTKGSILFISSIAAFHGLPGYALYSVSKMGLTSLAQSLRIENKNSEIFIGIAYVGFTENETDKRTLSKDGKYVEVENRSKFFTSPRSVTANLLLKQIANRIYKKVHSFTGKLLYFLSIYLPYIINIIHNRIYKNQKERKKY